MVNQKNNYVSIIMPTFNGARFITEAIESIIDQTYCNWELIIVVAPSTDGTINLRRKRKPKKQKIQKEYNFGNLKFKDIYVYQ